MCHENCKVCNYPDYIPEGLSNRRVADIVGCNESTVRRHKARMVSSGEEEPPLRLRRMWEAQGPDGEVKTLRSWSVNDEAQVEPLTYDELADLIDGFDFEDFDGYTVRGGTEALVIADPQIGKAMEHGGGSRDTVRRVMSGVRAAIERYKVARPRELYLIDGGDPIENCYSTPRQMGTNDLHLGDQIKVYRRMMIRVIKALLPYVDRVIYVSVTSNHGEIRTAPKSSPWSSEADWGLHIQESIQDAFEDNPKFDRVSFVRPEFLEDTAVFTTLDGTKVAVNHGHSVGSQANAKKWVMGQDHGRRPGWDADIWILNHFHNAYHLTTGNSRSILGTPSIDPGSLWYSKKTGESCNPGLLAVTIENHGWHNYSILV